MDEVSPIEKAFYLIERGYYPPETDVIKLAKLIEIKKANLTDTPKILNDIDTVYHDKTENDA